MCVIAIADEVRPTEEQIGKMFHSNDAGAGIAWREKGRVHWKKGLELEEVTELCAKVPLPYVVHFRIPSVGGKTPFLCHPFPVTAEVPLELQGTTKGYVLFHNGHWTRWRESTLEASIRSNTKVPGGKWSDTRAMAFHAFIYGSGILEMIDEKSVMFGPDKVEVFGGWSKEGGLWVSNRSWVTSSFRGSTRNEGTGHVSWHGHMPYQRTLPPGPTDADTAEKTDAVVVAPTEGPAQRRSAQTPAQVPEGVDLDTLPFDQITGMFEKQEISKKQWKKHRNRYEASIRRVANGGRKRQHRSVH